MCSFYTVVQYVNKINATIQIIKIIIAMHDTAVITEYKVV